MHGDGFVPVPIGIWNGQPATECMSDSSSAGMLSTMSLVFDVVRIAEAPCMQSTVLPVFKTFPGIALHHFHGPIVNFHAARRQLHLCRWSTFQGQLRATHSDFRRANLQTDLIAG